ncbi:hypothetical protein [Paenibacillus whitsoniae]|nr:hypothetical protein [Paenibacillus whitsoniae]
MRLPDAGSLFLRANERKLVVTSHMLNENGGSAWRETPEIGGKRDFSL